MSKWSDVIQKANTDPKFRQQLQDDPQAACRACGLSVDAGHKIEVYEQTESQWHFFLGRPTGRPEIDQLLTRAESDPGFKREFLENPGKTLRQAAGDSLPEGMKLFVHDRDPNALRIVLVQAEPADRELSERELEAVAGGTFMTRLKNLFCRNKDVTVIDEQTGIAGHGVDQTDGTIYGVGPGVYL